MNTGTRSTPNGVESKPKLEQFTVVKRGISYRRVSTDEQADKGFSLPGQLKEIEAYAAKNGIELVADFADDFTGSSLDRPGLTSARQWFKSGKADVIIAWDSDRLTREPAHYMMLRDEFNSLGIELHYAKRGKVDLKDFGQMLVEDFYGRFAHQWKQKIVENSKNGRRGKAEAGYVIPQGGMAPYGYNFVALDDKGKTLSVNEDEAKIVILIYRLYILEGLSDQDIATHLSQMGIPTRSDTHGKRAKKRGKGQWGRQIIAKILNSEVYRGVWHYGKRGNDPLIPVTVPAIVDEATWKAAQKRRKENRTNKRQERREYLLSGRLVCEYCQAPVCAHPVPWKSKNKKGVLLYYRCNVALHKRGDARLGGRCNAPRFKVLEVETAVWEWVKKLLLDPATLEKGLKKYQEESAHAAAPLTEELNRLENLIAKKQARLERARNLYLEGEEEKAVYLVEKRNLESDIASLENERDELKERLEILTLTPERIRDIHEFAAKVRRGLDLVDSEPDFQTKRQIMNLLDVRARLTVEDGEKIAHVKCIIDIGTISLLNIPHFNNSVP